MAFLLYLIFRAFFFFFALAVVAIALTIYFAGKLLIAIVEIVAEKREDRRRLPSKPKSQAFYSNRR